MDKEKRIVIDIKDIRKIRSQGKAEDMDRLIEQQVIEFKKTGKREGTIKVVNEYAKIINEEIPDIKKEEIENVISQFFDKRDLAKKVLEKQPFYYDDAKIWWFWNKTLNCWKITDETNILNIIGDISIANTINSKDKTEILEALRQEARKNKPKEIKKEWIQFKGEIFDIQTGERFKATPEYFAVNPIPFALSKDKYMETPVMDKIFSEWVGEENKKQLYEILAYCMLPDYPLHMIFWLNGSGLNGKTCFLNLLKKFIGKENITSTELDRLVSSRFEITKLHKKLACLMGETNFNDLNKTALLKQLTGQDLVGFEYKNKTPFDDNNYAKLIIATNNIPETTDKTIGFHRRQMIIDFPNTFSTKIDILATIPEEEYEYLALKCCGILNGLIKERAFTNEGSIEDRTKKYEDKSNPMAKFIKEFCNTQNPDGFIFSFKFAKRLNEWCKENRYRAFSEQSIGQKLKSLGFQNGREYADFGNHNQIRCWRGIEWIKGKQDT